MSGFSINFTHPWLLLLIIPAIGLTLFSYFTLSKRYRKNRNRITSAVLHSIVMLLAVFIISGMSFSYDIANSNNEIILLVDVSRSEDGSEEVRDEFVKNVLYDAMGDGYRVGLVTFGFGQEYAVPLTTDLNAVYDGYVMAERPDTTATDIASALTYAADLINHPQSSKIVLITDGKQTDNNALSVIRSVSSRGIKVDVANITSAYEGNELTVLGIQMPDYHLTIEEECTVSVTMQSNREFMSVVRLYDNGVLSGSYDQLIPEGVAELSVPHVFSTVGMHEIFFTVEVEGDIINENNSYYAYAYLEVFNKVLIVEREEGESEILKSILTENDAFKVDIKNINSTTDVLPSSVDEMRQYDQIILNNIANAEMPAGFGDNLYSYVYDYGGGVFTVGGDDDEGNANAYSNDSSKTVYGSLYQQMLPVQLIKDTPPVGVMVLVDRSASMAWNYGGIEKMEWAKQGTASCFNALTERDYIGILTFSWSVDLILEPTPRTQEAKILAAIDSLE
ncbi:MAG: VWA domain-containing protein, partial [Clostridia bacterium]|nr:VWA domain-containing protein [Clostridia bacterium]